MENKEIYDFFSSMNIVQKEVHDNAVKKKFWPTVDGVATKMDFAGIDNYLHTLVINEKLLLIHAEVSEAVEALRSGNGSDKHVPRRSSFEVELADAVIRIMDLAEACDISLAGAILDKINANLQREPLHGKKF